MQHLDGVAKQHLDLVPDLLVLDLHVVTDLVAAVLERVRPPHELEVHLHGSSGDHRRYRRVHEMHIFEGTVPDLFLDVERVALGPELFQRRVAAQLLVVEPVER